MKFTVWGEPVAKGRPRFSTRGGFVRSYTPEKTVSYENLVKLSFDTSEEKEMLKGEVVAIIKAYFSIPKSASKKQRLSMLGGEIHPTKKPDTDNIAKIILDSLNGRAFEDDKQVVVLQVEKHYSDEPRVEVEILEV
jgi:Holliday junction resolvase RusA-like endonuclease